MRAFFVDYLCKKFTLNLYMKTFLSLIFNVFVACFGFAQEAKVITYPVPETEKANCHYAVFVNGKPVDIYKAQSPVHSMYEGAEYYFCYFDFEGEVDVRVHSKNSFCRPCPYTITDPKVRAQYAKTNVSEVYPRYIKVYRYNSHNVYFKRTKPFQAIIMRDGIKMPLIVFGNPIEKNPPKKDDPNVVYFGAGLHYVKEPIILKDNQTLYVAGGAVLRSTMENLGVAFGAKDAKNVSIRGSGIISFDNRARFRNNGIVFRNCQNAKIEGVIIRDCNNWTVDFRNCNKVLVENLKICGSRMINDDAIDICNSQNVVIKNTFCRVQDDAIAIKGVPEVEPSKPVENVLIENCIFWVDSANVFRVGYDCFAPYFKNIKCKNIYVPFYAKYQKPTEYWTHSIFLFQPTNDITIENFEVDGLHIRSNGDDMSLLVAKTHPVHNSSKCGNMKNCKIKNVHITGKKGKFRGEVFIEGKDENYKITDVSVENVYYFGKKKTFPDKDVHIGPYTENIKIFKK